MEPYNMNLYSFQKISNICEDLDVVASLLNQPQPVELKSETIDELNTVIGEFSNRIDQFVSEYKKYQMPEAKNINQALLNSSSLALGNVFLLKMNNLNISLVQSLQKLQSDVQSDEVKLMDYMHQKNWAIYDLSSNLKRNIELFEIAKPTIIFG